MKVTLIGRTRGLTDVCAEAAAICTASTDAAKALQGALACGHESVIEHASYTFRIEGVSRVLLAQLTRHRIASFSVQSQRYVNQSESSVIVPPSMTKDLAIAKQVADFVHAAGALYDRLVAAGVPQEDARYILLMGGECELIMTMNARELGHFLSLRMCNRAQWEIRDLADRIYMILVKTSPEIFRRCGPGCVRGRCPQGRRSCGHSRTIQVQDMLEDCR